MPFCSSWHEQLGMKMSYYQVLSGVHLCMGHTFLVVLFLRIRELSQMHTALVSCVCPSQNLS